MERTFCDENLVKFFKLELLLMSSTFDSCANNRLAGGLQALLSKENVLAQRKHVEASEYSTQLVIDGTQEFEDKLYPKSQSEHVELLLNVLQFGIFDTQTYLLLKSN
jgi:hypothetical protein